MVSSVLFYQLHRRLNEIFGFSDEAAFAGIPALVCGDFYQLPPAGGVPVYLSKSSTKECLSLDLWRTFLLAELTEVVRQRGDSDFIRLLNKIRVGIVDKDVETTLSAMFFNINSPSYPKHAVHMFAKNAPARGHNKEKLNETDTPLVCINAQDETPQEVKLTQMQIDGISERRLVIQGI